MRRLLAPYGIRPGRWRPGPGLAQVRGYRRADSAETWDRYLATLQQVAQAAQVAQDDDPNRAKDGIGVRPVPSVPPAAGPNGVDLDDQDDTDGPVGRDRVRPSCGATHPVGTKTSATDVPPHCSMGFNQTWVLLNSVLPVAKQKYGGFDAEAVRQAALDVDIPPGGTIQGYGVKFYRPGTPLSGQNERSTPVVMQNAGEHISVVWPSNIKTQDPVR